MQICRLYVRTLAARGPCIWGFLPSGPQETSQNIARDSICCIEKKTNLNETQVTRLAYQGIICDTKVKKRMKKKYTA